MDVFEKIKEMEKLTWEKELSDALRGTGWMVAFDSMRVMAFHRELNETKHFGINDGPVKLTVKWLKEYAEFRLKENAREKRVKFESPIKPEDTLTLETGVRVGDTFMPIPKGFNVQSLPRTEAMAVGKEFVSNPSAPEGVMVMTPNKEYQLVSISSGFGLPPDVDWENTGEDAYEEAFPTDAPCSCPSMLEGHKPWCSWHKAPDERETERQRLEKCWAIPKPREPLSYKTMTDTFQTGNMSREVQKFVKLGIEYGMGQRGIESLLEGKK